MKNKLRLGLVILSTGVLVSSCSKVSAQLKNGDDPIVVDNNNNKVEVEQNTINKIFNSIKTEDTYTTSVQELLIEGLSNAYIGTYKVNSQGNVYIEELGENASDTKILEFVKDHKFYWNWVSTSTSVQYEEEFNESNLNDYKERINAYIELVQKEIVKTIYNEAVVSTYMKNNKFYESLYAKSLYDKMYKIYDANGSKIDVNLLYENPDYKSGENELKFKEAGFTFGKLITRVYDPEKDYKMIIEGEEEGEEPLLHLYHYVDYINNSIIPDITSDLLTTSYIFEKQYQSIGRTQSRHLNFVKIADSEANKAEQMLTEYVDKYLQYETESNVNYDSLIEAWIGNHNSINDPEDETLDLEIKEEAKKLADAVYGEEITKIDSEFISYIDGKAGEDYPYYDGSLYGDIIKDYSHLTNNPITNDTSLYSSFTSIGDLPFTPEDGLNEKIEELSTTSYVTNKWGNSGTFDLGDTNIVTNLFSYGLASEFVTAKDSDTTFAVDGYYLKQFSVGGPTFLKKTSYSNPIDSIIWNNDSDYYIIEVVDQVSLSTLALSSDASDEERKTIENYARQIGYTIAQDGTYTSNAVLYYLEQSNINYYDQDVYDYFEETYPDLFE